MGFNKANNTDRMKYLKGPKYWSENLQFWNEPGRNYSQKAKDYYNEWLNEMFKRERVETKLQ